MRPQDVEVVRIRHRPFRSRPDLLAFVDAKIAGIKVMGIQIVSRPAKPIMIDFPAVEAKRMCNACSFRSVHSNRFCPKCGVEMSKYVAERKPNGYRKLSFTVCHPVDIPTRRVIEGVILEAYVDDLVAEPLPVVQAEPTLQRPPLRFRPLDEFDDEDVVNAAYPA